MPTWKYSGGSRSHCCSAASRRISADAGPFVRGRILPGQRPQPVDHLLAIADGAARLQQQATPAQIVGGLTGRDRHGEQVGRRVAGHLVQLSRPQHVPQQLRVLEQPRRGGLFVQLIALTRRDT